ncbi:MAG: hypothetical protein QM728_05735 [Gordonia sp. (in: high G+C Gram-positive bacteria)]|uniref:hypothetical protein n=1 Tax=Gordonia sp. (in: high G+C Gram-positive bacteria) TaxID=84139 RepID=UPI0039E45347
MRTTTTLAKAVAAATLTTAALTAGTAAANAAPRRPAGPTPSNPLMITTPIAPGITYSGNASTGRAELATPWGTVKTAPGAASVSDNRGKAVWGDPKTTGLAPVSDAPTAPPAPLHIPVPGTPGITLPTPAAPTAWAATAPGSTRVDDDSSVAPKTQEQKDADIQNSLNNVGNNFGLATGVGAFVGGAGGAIIGCPLGAVTGGALTALAFPLTPLGVVGGCIMGAGAVAGIGAVIGGAVVGVPVGIASAIFEYQLLRAHGDL